MCIVLYWCQPAVPHISRDWRSYCEVTKERWLLFVGGFNSDKDIYLDELSQTVPFLLKWVFTISKIKDQKYLHHNQSLCSDFSLCHSSERHGWHSLWGLAEISVLNSFEKQWYYFQKAINFKLPNRAQPWICIHSIHISIVNHLFEIPIPGRRVLLGTWLLFRSNESEATSWKSQWWVFSFLVSLVVKQPGCLISLAPNKFIFKTQNKQIIIKKDWI